MTASLLFAEFRYCSAPAGPNQAAPQGCQQQCLVVGGYVMQIPGANPAWYGGDIVLTCVSQKPSDGCYDYNYATQPNPTCNRIQQPCGGGLLIARPDGGSGCFGYPLSALPNPVTFYIAGFNPDTDANCNNVFWLKAEGGMVNGVNCTKMTSGLY